MSVLNSERNDLGLSHRAVEALRADLIECRLIASNFDRSLKRFSNLIDHAEGILNRKPSERESLTDRAASASELARAMGQ